MIWYLFTVIGFPPPGSGRQTCIKVGKRQNNKRNNTETQNTQNRKQKYITNTSIKRILKNISRLVGNNKEKHIIMRQRTTQNQQTIT
jgi:hypothetical protein